MSHSGATVLASPAASALNLNSIQALTQSSTNSASSCGSSASSSTSKVRYMVVGAVSS